MTPYDAIVIGSGITGGWAAKELCEHGLKTLVLEAGRDIQPAQDYTEHVQPWQMHFRGWGDRTRLEHDQPIQRNCYACDELGSKFFVNDLETERPNYTTTRLALAMRNRGHEIWYIAPADFASPTGA